MDNSFIDPDFDIEIKLMLEAVYLKYQYDFRDYSIASLRRRLRIAMTQFNCQTLSQLQDKVLHDETIFPKMLQYFTVQVSEMFRDPSYFKFIREHVVPLLKTYPSFKLWVAGCSTGEEVWSLAILLAEEDLLHRSLIYATDINSDSLKVAESGVYAIDKIALFSENYQKSGGKSTLSDYYVAAYDNAILDRSLKQYMVFADHSLATDSVFSEVHFVSCRNVLIYFNLSLQNRAIKLFRDALVPRGFLGLGNKESLRCTNYASDFEELASSTSVYRLV